MIARDAASYALAVLVALLTLATSCGVPVDEVPRDIPLDVLPPALATGLNPQRASGGEGGSDWQIWLVGESDQLTPRTRSIVLSADGIDPQSNAKMVLDELLIGPTVAEREAGLTTAIPIRGTSYIDIILQPDGVAVVDLTESSLRGVRGNEQKLAIGQIVYSFHGLFGINQLSFSRNGTPISVTDDTGSTVPGEPVNRSNFRSLDPTRPAFGASDEFDGLDPTPVPTVRPAAPAGSEALIQTVDIFIWLVDDGQLVPVVRSIERTPEAILDALLIGPFPAERSEGLVSALPPDALANNGTAIDLNESTSTAFIDLAVGSLPGLTEDQRFLAIGQIVWSMTELYEIDQVSISIEGLPQSFPTSQGITEIGQILRRRDFDTSSAAGDTAPSPAATFAPAPLTPAADASSGGADDSPSAPADGTAETPAEATGSPTPAASATPIFVPTTSATPAPTPTPTPDAVAPPAPPIPSAPTPTALPTATPNATTTPAPTATP